MWHVVLIRLNCGAEKNIQSLMTFVLGDKLAGVTLTLQLVNLDGPAGHLGSRQELQGPRRLGTAGAPCQPAALLQGGCWGEGHPWWGQRRGRLCPQTLPACPLSPPGRSSDLPCVGGVWGEGWNREGRGEGSRGVPFRGLRGCGLSI